MNSQCREKKWREIKRFCAELVICFACFLLVPALPVLAQGSISLKEMAVQKNSKTGRQSEGIRLGGGVKLMPLVIYKVEYNDNVFLENAGKDDDFIHRIQPNIELKARMRGGFNFTLGYGLNIVAYNDLDENNYIAHNPYFEFSYDSPQGFYARGSDRFTRTEDPHGSDYNTYGIGEQTKRANNTANITLGYKFGNRYSVEGSYKNFIEHYDSEADKHQNHLDHTAGLAFLYNLTPKTALLGQYRYTMAEYTEQNDGIVNEFGLVEWDDKSSQDYDIHAFFMGARFAPGGKLSGEAKIGYSVKNFKNKMDKLDREYEDSNTFVLETNMAYQLRRRTNLSLKLNRSHKGSPDNDAASYIDSMVGFYVTQGIGDRFEVMADAEWNNIDYQDEYAGANDKYYNIYTARLAASWKLMRWLSGKAGYSFATKTASNGYENDEYDNNVLWMALEGKI